MHSYKKSSSLCTLFVLSLGQYLHNIIKAAQRYAEERLADRSEKPALRQAQAKLGSL
jgi:hypothetical protein